MHEQDCQQLGDIPVDRVGINIPIGKKVLRISWEQLLLQKSEKKRQEQLAKNARLNKKKEEPGVIQSNQSRPEPLLRGVIHKIRPRDKQSGTIIDFTTRKALHRPENSNAFLNWWVRIKQRGKPGSS